MDPRAAGCNALIRDGATLIRSAQDVIDSLGPPETLAAPSPKQPSLHFTPPDQIATKILTLLGPTAVAEDSLIRDVGLPAAEITPHLTTLELEGKIQRHPGGLLALAS
jgi:DNA processing protein